MGDQPPAFHRLGFTMEQLSRPGPWTTSERWIVLLVVRRMRIDPKNDEHVSWPSMRDIAKRSGSSVATVKRALARHCNGPLPLLSASSYGRRSAMSIVHIVTH